MSETSDLHVVQIHPQPRSYARRTDYNHNRIPTDRSYEAFDVIETIETVSLSSAATGTSNDIDDDATVERLARSYDRAYTCFVFVPLCILGGALLLCLLLLALHTRL